MTTETPIHLPDVNVLLALTNAEHPHFGRAHAWWPTAERWATTPITETGFVRLSLNPAAALTRRPLEQVVAVLDGLLAQPGHEFIADDSTLTTPRIELSGLIGHQQVTDFHLVNLVAMHDAVFVTLDTRLARSLAAKDRRHVLAI